MAMQIMPGELKGKNIIYRENCKMINVTDTLRPICNEFFEEETVLENKETITVEIAHLNNIMRLSDRIESDMLALLDKVEKTRGDEARKDIVLAIKDLVLLRSLIITLLSTNPYDVVLTIS